MCLFNNILKPYKLYTDSSIQNEIDNSIIADCENIKYENENIETVINKHKNVIVILDFGHGKDTCGKKSPYSMCKVEPCIEFEEWEWNRKFGKLLADKLRFDDYNVEYTLDPNDVTDYSLTNRYKKANQIINENLDKHCIFISIHANACGRGDKWKKAQGFSVYTTKGQNTSDILAEYILDAAEENLPKYGRKIRCDKTDGDKDYEENFTVIYGANCPAVLIEHGFYDNVDECKWLLSEEGMEALSEINLQGINNFTNYKWNC